MRMAKSVSRVLIASAMLSPAWGLPPQNAAQPETTSTVTLQNVEQRLGPFTIAGQSFNIVLHNKRIVGAPSGDFGQTLVKLEIHDQSGAVLYQKAFAYQLEGTKFQQVVTASAQLLPGDNLTGLLVSYTHQPIAPGNEQSWQVFGFRNGKLALFDQPDSAESAMNTPGQFTGVIARAPNGAVPMPIRGPLDSSELRVWTGEFYVIVPLRVDWRSGNLMAGQRCLETGMGGLRETGCDMRVEAERTPSSAEFNFARLFPTPEENLGTNVQHAVIKKGADVQLLKARSIVTWTVDEDVMRIGFPNLWLKVLIDNNTENEGWIHGEQDFAAVGLPPRGPPR